MRMLSIIIEEQAEDPHLFRGREEVTQMIAINRNAIIGI